LELGFGRIFGERGRDELERKEGFSGFGMREEREFQALNAKKLSMLRSLSR